MKFLYKIIIISILISQSVLADIKKLEKFEIISHKDSYKNDDRSENDIYYGIVKDGKMSRGIYFYPYNKHPEVGIWLFTTREKKSKYGGYFHKVYSIRIDTNYNIIGNLRYFEFPENGESKQYPDLVNSNDDLKKILELIKYDIDLPFDLNKDYEINIPELTEQKLFEYNLRRVIEIQKIKFEYTSDEEKKIKKYILKRIEMKRNCDGMWFNRKLAGTMTDQQIIDMCKPMGYDVISKTWKYEPKSVKKVLRKYGFND